MVPPRRTLTAALAATLALAAGAALAQEGSNPLEEVDPDLKVRKKNPVDEVDPGASGGTPATPVSPAHAFNQHGPSATGYANWVMSRDDGLAQSATDWLVDPGHPDAAQWIVDAATSIVANYAVDGVNLDRIRYPDYNSAGGQPTWGYNPVAIARFQQATDFTRLEDRKLRHRLAYLDGLSSDKLGIERGVSVLQQHGHNFLKVLVQFIQRFALRMCAGKSWNVSDIQSCVRAPLHHCRVGLHGQNLSCQHPNVKAQGGLIPAPPAAWLALPIWD